MKFHFAFPKPNGDMPTMKVVSATTLKEAVRDILKSHGYDPHYCTVFDSSWQSLGVLDWTWPGPTVYVGKTLIGKFYDTNMPRNRVSLIPN